LMPSCLALAPQPVRSFRRPHPYARRPGTHGRLLHAAQHRASTMEIRRWTMLKTGIKRIVATATALPMAVTTSAFAQDVIGAAPVSQSAILTFKAIAVAGVGWGFLRLMSGRHT
jgi:hypothetical protein